MNVQGRRRCKVLSTGIEIDRNAKQAEVHLYGDVQFQIRNSQFQIRIASN